MYQDDEEYKKIVMDNIYHVFSQDLLPLSHVAFLEKLCCDKRGKINVIYDIGSCTMHWFRHAKRIWPYSEIVCFDAFSPLVELYKKENVKFENVLLSDVDNMRIKFYQNDMLFGGNSYNRENTIYFPPDKYILKDTITLDTLIENKKYPFADLIKIDSQCSELDILKGASKCLEHCTFLILEIPEENSDYNIGGYKQHEIIDYLKNIGYLAFAPKFSSNLSDSDWSFINKNKIFNNL
jgi:FkbM family methyltransferase